jgi:hypothetical protein
MSEKTINIQQYNITDITITAVKYYIASVAIATQVRVRPKKRVRGLLGVGVRVFCCFFS